MGTLCVFTMCAVYVSVHICVHVLLPVPVYIEVTHSIIFHISYGYGFSH